MQKNNGERFLRHRSFENIHDSREEFASWRYLSQPISGIKHDAIIFKLGTKWAGSRTYAKRRITLISKYLILVFRVSIYFCVCLPIWDFCIPAHDEQINHGTSIELHTMLTKVTRACLSVPLRLCGTRGMQMLCLWFCIGGPGLFLFSPIPFCIKCSNEIRRFFCASTSPNNVPQMCCPQPAHTKT